MLSPSYRRRVNVDSVPHSENAAVDHRAPGPPRVLHAIPIAGAPLPGADTRAHVTIDVDNDSDGKSFYPSRRNSPADHFFS